MNKCILRIVIVSVIGLMGTGVAAPAGRAVEKRIGFTIPAAPWTLTVAADEFGVSRKQIDPNGRFGYNLLIDRDRHLVIMITVSPVNGCQDSKTCRDMSWSKYRSRLDLQNVALTEIGEASCLEFVDPMLLGYPVRQLNVLAFFVVDGFEVDFRMTSPDKSRNRKLFAQIIQSAKFEPK